MVDPLQDFIDMLDTNWSNDTGGDKPEIANIMDYRAVNIANMDCVLLSDVTEPDEFLGIGALEFRRMIGFAIIIKTSISRDRARQILEEVRRILRTKAYWGPYHNVLLSSVRDLTEVERKIWSYRLLVAAFRIETV